MYERMKTRLKVINEETDIKLDKQEGKTGIKREIRNTGGGGGLLKKKK